MIIRPGVKNDKEQIVKLVTEFDTYFTKEHLFSESVLPFITYKDKETLFENVVENWLTNVENFVFVAEEEGQLVGHIVGSIQTKNDRVLDKEGSIDEWFVTEEYRYKSVGQKLYVTLVEVFKQHGCDHLGLKVYSANKKTIDMYHQMGFVDLELQLVKTLD